ARKVKTGGKGTVKPNYVPKDSSGKKLGVPKNIDEKLVNGTTHKPDSMNPHTQIGIKRVEEEDIFKHLSGEETGSRSNGQTGQTMVEGIM
ncbi:hypothetical protein, partial [Shouchella clausii]